MEVTIVMQMFKAVWNVSKSLPALDSESLEYAFEIFYYTLVHKGSSVCALFIAGDTFRYACIYLKTKGMTKQIQNKMFSCVQTQNPVWVSFSRSLLASLSLFLVPCLSLKEGLAYGLSAVFKLSKK